jgi:hypothetical protein
MKINYELTKDDYIQYNIFHLSYSKTAKNAMLLQRFLVPIMFMLLSFLFSRVSEIPLWLWLVCFSIASIVWVIAYPKYIRSIIRKRASKMLNEGRNTGMLGKQSIELTEDGIVKTNESSESKSKWNIVENIVETKDYIFIYISAVMAYVIPTRAFSDNEEKGNFVNTLNKMVNLSKLSN